MTRDRDRGRGEAQRSVLVSTPICPSLLLIATQIHAPPLLSVCRWVGEVRGGAAALGKDYLVCVSFLCFSSWCEFSLVKFGGVCGRVALLGFVIYFCLAFFLFYFICICYFLNIC